MIKTLSELLVAVIAFLFAISTFEYFIKPTLILSGLEPPSSYNASCDADKAFKDIESAWDKKCPSDWKTRESNLVIRYQSNPEEPYWEAVLEVHARNVPRLMKEGFYWSLDNVQRQDSHFLTHREDIREAQIEPSFVWNLARTYSLKDMSPPNSPNKPQWVARLINVMSDDLRTLSDFRLLKDLTIDKTLTVVANDWNGRRNIYMYDAQQGPKCNSMYDDMPLEGWWPWPKEQAVEQKGDDDLAKA